MSYIGKRIRRKEDPPLITGQGRFVDDIVLPGSLRAVIVPSIYPHARLRSVNVTEACKAKGVVAVYTYKDIAGRIGALSSCFKMPGLKVTEHTVLASNKVYFVGHP